MEPKLATVKQEYTQLASQTTRLIFARRSPRSTHTIMAAAPPSVDGIGIANLPNQVQHMFPSFQFCTHFRSQETQNRRQTGRTLYHHGSRYGLVIHYADHMH